MSLVNSLFYKAKYSVLLPRLRSLFGIDEMNQKPYETFHKNALK